MEITTRCMQYHSSGSSPAAVSSVYSRRIAAAGPCTSVPLGLSLLIIPGGWSVAVTTANGSCTCANRTRECREGSSSWILAWNRGICMFNKGILLCPLL